MIGDLGGLKRLLVGLAAFLAACTGDNLRPSVQVRDSAGVRIVTHTVLDPRVDIELDDEIHAFGSSAGDYQFVAIASGTLRRDGGAVVADRGTREVVVLDSSGVVEWTAGGMGEGPGEFTQLSAAGWHADTVLAYDGSSRRLTRLVSGAVASTTPLPDGMGMMRPLWIEDSEVRAVPTSYLPVTPEPWVQGALVRHTVGSSTVDTVLTYPIAQGFPDVSALRDADPFRGHGTIAANRGRIAHGRTDQAEIRVMDAEGRLEQIWRWAPPSREATSEFWTRYREWVMTTPGAQTADERRATVADVEARSSGILPVFGGIEVDGANRFWVQAFDPTDSAPSTFWLFGSNGEWLGRATLPARTQILDIGADRILAVRRDAFDVQSVVVLALPAAILSSAEQ